MKKLLLTVFLLITISCEQKATTPSIKQTSVNTEDFRIQIIDNCEYLIHKQEEGNWTTYGITHKGNCHNHSASLYTK